MSGGMDVCQLCSDNFIVNTKTIKCDICELKFHTNCASLKDTWIKILAESPNLKWFCNSCIEKLPTQWCHIMSVDKSENNSSDILLKEIDCLNREKDLLLKSIRDLDYTVSLQKSIIESSKRDLPFPNHHNIVKNVTSNRNVNNSYSSVTARSNRDTHELPQDDPKKSAVPYAANVSVSGRKINKCDNIPNPNMVNNTSTGNEKSDYSVIPTRKGSELQNDADDGISVLDSQNSNKINTEWQTTRKRNRPKKRKFVVGCGGSNLEVKTIPKYTHLHVSRLHPSTKPENLQKLLIATFPEVQCELLKSKHPLIYSSIKVSIYQENFEKAWCKDIWPDGALVSKYFLFKKDTLQLDGVQNKEDLDVEMTRK